MVDGRHIEKKHKLPYLAKVGPIAAKFGTVTHFDHLHPIGH